MAAHFFFFFKDFFGGFFPLIGSAVKSGTGNEREKRWGVDRRNDNGPDSNLCPPWASSLYAVGATASATVPPSLQYFEFGMQYLGSFNNNHNNKDQRQRQIYFPIHPRITETLPHIRYDMNSSPDGFFSYT